MDKVAKLREGDRRDLFRQTAANRGFHPAIAEKDFWVCWVLMKLFGDTTLQDQIVFKGGTSLSKVHHLIDRFSEDIDLVLNWELLGYGKGKSDPWLKLPSNTQLDKFNKEFNQKAAHYIANTLLAHIRTLLSSCSDIRAEISGEDSQAISIFYPASFQLQSLRPEVRLELGPLASWVPSGRYSIRPFAAEEFPQLFDEPECSVIAITAERTFWEKATILHQQAHRTSIMPSGYSRHYYDLHQLALSPVAKNALSDLNLLEDVIQFKSRFYHSPWARYDLAKPGTFRLLPTPRGDRELQADYQYMASMFFSKPPTWSQILETLGALEEQINRI